MEAMNDRLVKLEHEQNKSLQYSRRDSIEISGIPSNIRQKDLEGKVIKIFAEGRLKARDIQACHGVGKKGATIVKFVNRKFAREGLFCGRNLHGKNCMV